MTRRNVPPVKPATWRYVARVTFAHPSHADVGATADLWSRRGEWAMTTPWGKLPGVSQIPDDRREPQLGKCDGDKSRVIALSSFADNMRGIASLRWSADIVAEMRWDDKTAAWIKRATAPKCIKCGRRIKPGTTLCRPCAGDVARGNTRNAVAVKRGASQLKTMLDAATKADRR